MIKRFVVPSFVGCLAIGAIVFAASAGHAQGAPSRLLAKARAEGQVRVIIGLRAPRMAFQPEGKLASATAVARQRGAIAATRQTLIGRLPVNAEVYATWSSLPYVAVKVDAATLQQVMKSSFVTTVQEDGLSEPHLASATAHIGAADVFAAGCDGAGQTVVILDTGIDADHPFFGGRVVDEACFSDGAGGGTSLCPNGGNSQTGAGAADALTAQCLNGAAPLCDHGTHVAGIAAGRDPGPPTPTGFNGVAPAANIIAIQVFTRFNADADCGGDPGDAPCVKTYDSDLMSALDYVNNTLRPSWTISSVNMSLGGDDMKTAACDGDSRKAAIDNLLSNGIATVISSGNDDWTDALAAPGCISTAVTVGNVFDPTDDVVDNMHAVVDILAAGRFVDSSIPDDDYGSKSGTSMAAPEVAGAFAIIRELAPTMTIADILTLLQTTGVQVTDGRPANPAGAATGTTKPRLQLDAAAATLKEADLEIAKTADPDPVSPGQVLTYEIAVTNHGPEGALHVVVVDVLPPQVSYLTATDACLEGPVGTLTCTLGSIPPGTTRTFTILGTVDANFVAQACEPVSITNQASVSAATTDPVPDNNSVATATRIVFPLDHFLCYEVALQPFDRHAGVTLDDVFGAGIVDVSNLKRLCTPTDKNGEDPTAPREPCHLAAYEIDESRPFKAVKRVTVDNQFGVVTVDVGRPERLLVPTANGLLPPPLLVTPTIDHFKCHRVRGARTRVRGLTLQDQIDTRTGNVVRPLRLCSPANKNDEGILAPDVHLMCYEVRTQPRRPSFDGPFFINNQFDDFRIDLTGTRELCVPSTLLR